MSSHRHSQCHTDVPAALLVAADSPECGSGSCVCETQVPTAGRAVSFPLSPSGRSDEETSTSTSYFSGALRLNDVEAVPFYNTCVLWLFSAWFSRLNSSERNDARVVVYPRYMSEKAVWKTQDQSSRELRWCSEKQTKILKKGPRNSRRSVRWAAPGCLRPETSSVQPTVAPAGCFWRADVAAAAAPQTSDTSDWITNTKEEVKSKEETVQILFPWPELIMFDRAHILKPTWDEDSFQFWHLCCIICANTYDLEEFGPLRCEVC